MRHFTRVMSHELRQNWGLEEWMEREELRHLWTGSVADPDQWYRANHPVNGGAVSDG